MNSDVEVFARNLKLIRKAKSLSQTKLAEQIGLTKQSIINYEKGVTFPTGKRLNRLLEVLEVTPEQLLGSNALQSHYETKMHHTIKNKSDFMLGYELQIEENPAELRSYLFDQISLLTDTELYTCLYNIHDQKIQEAIDLHISNIVNDTLYPSNQSAEWDFDITVDHGTD